MALKLIPNEGLIAILEALPPETVCVRAGDALRLARLTEDLLEQNEKLAAAVARLEMREAYAP